jgi:hypothetical protein
MLGCLQVQASAPGETGRAAGPFLSHCLFSLKLRERFKVVCRAWSQVLRAKDLSDEENRFVFSVICFVNRFRSGGFR